MDETIETEYKRAGFSTVREIVLSETPRTRTVFSPGFYDGGVRGEIIRQKRGSNGEWASTNEVDFRSLAPDCGVRIDLDTEATRTLCEKLNQLYEIQSQGAPRTSQSYIVAAKNKAIIIDDDSKGQAIQQLLERGYSEEFWQALSRDKPDLAAQLAKAKLQFDREQAIKVFELSIAQHPTNEDYWQKFFEAHPWMIQTAFSSPVFMLNGETYVGGKAPLGRQGVGGVATDFLFADESTKSFAVIDIKTPQASLIGGRYRGKRDTGRENETYEVHGDLSGGIIQIRNQISVAVKDFATNLGRHFEKLNQVHPAGVLVAGMANSLTQRQKDSFNLFRHTLHGLTVITFDELLHRLRLLFTEEGNRRNINANQQDSSTSPPQSPWGDTPF